MIYDLRHRSYESDKDPEMILAILARLGQTIRANGANDVEK